MQFCLWRSQQSPRKSHCGACSNYAQNHMGDIGKYASLSCFPRCAGCCQQICRRPPDQGMLGKCISLAFESPGQQVVETRGLGGDLPEVGVSNSRILPEHALREEAAGLLQLIASCCAKLSSFFLKRVTICNDQTLHDTTYRTPGTSPAFTIGV